MRVEDYGLKVSKTSEIRGRDEGAVPCCDRLGGDDDGDSHDSGDDEITATTIIAFPLTAFQRF